MTIIKNKPLFINNLFDDFFGALNTTAQNEFTVFSMPTNVHETEDGYHLEINAPARTKENFKINVEKNLLTVSYEQKEETETKNYKTIRREFSSKSFKRSFSVDENTIKVDEIKAKYDAGILHIYLPKKATEKVLPKEISVL